MPLNIDWQQILLHLLNFVILFAGLWLLLYKPVRKFMQNRREHYEKTDAEAEKKLAEAEEKRAEYEQKLGGADAEIEEKRVAARKEMDSYEALRKRAAEEEAASILTEARENAARERERALTDARSEIAGLVTEATEKIVLRESASEAYDQFLDAAERAEKKDGGDA
ncbi:MAG TPA: ATP synthase F0 subunit B [Firmicutes bacterium]|nr:ATP synthase F0 subunit B [Bacillota bacterium]